MAGRPDAALAIGHEALAPAGSAHACKANIATIAALATVVIDRIRSVPAPGPSEETC